MESNTLNMMMKIDRKINSECKCGNNDHSIYVYKSCMEYYQNKKRG